MVDKQVLAAKIEEHVYFASAIQTCQQIIPNGSPGCWSWFVKVKFPLSIPPRDATQQFKHHVANGVGPMFRFYIVSVRTWQVQGLNSLFGDYLTRCLYSKTWSLREAAVLKVSHVSTNYIGIARGQSPTYVIFERSEEVRSVPCASLTRLLRCLVCTHDSWAHVVSHSNLNCRVNRSCS